MTMVGIGDRPRTEPVGGPEAMIAVADDIKLDFTHDDELVDQDKRDTEYVTEFPEKERRRIVRKVDMRLVPVLTLLYLFSYLDRANIGNAKIEGLTDSLNMSGIQYNVALSGFFITYVVFELPSNFLIERYFRLRPSTYLGIITVLWGIMMTMHGVVKSYAGLLACRLLLGVFEAGFMPAAILLMGKWYLKFEYQSRFAIFYGGAAISGAFSGLLAYAIAKMDGAGGYEGWRWIFLLEGLATVIFGALLPFILPDTPETKCSWLNEEDRRYLQTRIVHQEGGTNICREGQRFQWKTLIAAVADFQTYIFVLISYSNIVPGIGMKFTMPQIIKNMGYTSSNAQLMTIPPYVCGGISAYCFGMLADKFKRRFYFLIIPQLFLIIGFSILTSMTPHVANNVAVCYFGLILTCIGIYPIQPCVNSWYVNNIAGSAKRAMAVGWFAGISNAGGVPGSYIYIASEAPDYPTGFGTSLAFAVLGMLCVFLIEFLYIRTNRKRDEVSEEETRAKFSDRELADKGNHSPLFRYTL